MAELTHTLFKNTQTIDEALARDGGVIVDDFASASQITNIHQAFVNALEEVPWCNNDDNYDLGNKFFGFTTKRLHGVVQHHPEIANCLTHPEYQDLARRHLGKRIMLSTGELMAIGPGEVQQQLHRDGDSWIRAKQANNVLISANIALTNFRKENGATVVIPGSHTWTDIREPNQDEVAYAEMESGSALLYSGKLVHGGGANSTSETRMGLYFGYIPSWLRPLENSCITVPRELLETLPNDLQQILGYSRSGFDANP
jgi:ectoine hydroxylase-related dioxygenase (phytanoyl-CoA dioxygenase family)